MPQLEQRDRECQDDRHTVKSTVCDCCVVLPLRPAQVRLMMHHSIYEAEDLHRALLHAWDAQLRLCHTNRPRTDSQDVSGKIKPAVCPSGAILCAIEAAIACDVPLPLRSNSPEDRQRGSSELSLAVSVYAA